MKPGHFGTVLLGAALLILSPRISASMEVVIEGQSDVMSVALDEGSGNLYVFTASYNSGDPIPGSGLITEYRRDGVPLAAYLVPPEAVAGRGQHLSYDSSKQVFVLGGAAADEAPTYEFNKAGQLLFVYSFAQVAPRGSNAGTVSGMDVDRKGLRYYLISPNDPYYVVAVSPINIEDGYISPDDAEIVFTVPPGIDAGAFFRDFHSGKFLLGSGGNGVIYDFNSKGNPGARFSLVGLGFGPPFYEDPNGGYFMTSIAIEDDGSLLIGAYYRPGSGRTYRVVRLSRSEWRSLPSKQ